jgi:hypothetical protein
VKIRVIPWLRGFSASLTSIGNPNDKAIDSRQRHAGMTKMGCHICENPCHSVVKKVFAQSLKISVIRVIRLIYGSDKKTNLTENG